MYDTSKCVVLNGLNMFSLIVKMPQVGDSTNYPWVIKNGLLGKPSGLSMIFQRISISRGCPMGFLWFPQSFSMKAFIYSCFPILFYIVPMIFP